MPEAIRSSHRLREASAKLFRRWSPVVAGSPLERLDHADQVAQRLDRQRNNSDGLTEAGCPTVD